MIRHHLAALLGVILARLCDEHIPLIGTDPLVCARCWNPIRKATA